MLADEIPVQPTDFVVLTIGIVVAVLGTAGFVAHQQHGGAQGEQSDGQKILRLPVAEFLNGWIIAWALDAAIPASIVVGAIAVIFSVCLVVFSVVRDKVIQCETIVARYEVDALFGLAFFVSVNLRTADDSVRYTPDGTRFAAKKAANIIAKSTIPLFPAVSNKAAYLVQASGIPGFCNHLCACERRVRVNVPEYGRVREWIA